MGRIKTQLIKRSTVKLLEAQRERFTDNFEENKKTAQEMLTDSSKKLRNIIAGYATRLVKNDKDL
ncbi:MAG: 30S ribosomal protein S17e [Nanoarchaeota archaeon]|nr:30S ribosomal protein S17e [Nanoarchaeota archaeon]